MSVAPEGNLSLPLHYLKETIAASARFQSIVGALDANEAKASIIKFWADESKAAHAMPRCVVRNLNEDEAVRSTTSGWNFTGPLMMYFEFPIPAEHQDDHEDAGTWFANQVGVIRQEMRNAAVANPDQYLNIQKIELVDLGEGKPDENEGTPWWGAEFHVHWQN